MRVLVAGAGGAVGRQLLPPLVRAGHQVTGTTRFQSRAEEIRDAGAEPVIVDVTELAALREVVTAARPEVVVNELTSLPEALNYRDKEALEPTNRLRREVGPELALMAAEAGARRLVVQSVAFFYAPTGQSLKTEEDPVMEIPADSPLSGGPPALRALEESALGTRGLDGLVLRYGYFYGPGTYFAPDGSSFRRVRRRRFPIVGNGRGIFSFIHVEDAAAATLAAVERGAPGIYNITDDEPAPMNEWLPFYAEAIGAKPPLRVPSWLAQVVAGEEAASLATRLRGASNAKAKRELGWAPRYPSWRQGFREALG
ncbi:MAG TPA: NAD(P)-dependent oxidoreductase [Solirubrobacterales bacterium]|jgi:nucleoside-diphosphate-sugar epimerase|nr:NAD(P)-dependent oxidoreductase [Solirubrobacterales bacterium]